MHIFGIGIVGLLIFALWLFCIIDVITTDQSDMQHLPKMVWLLIVIILPTVGSIVWLVVGRPRSIIAGSRRPVAPPQSTSRFPEYDRPGRHIAQNPDDDEAFLRRVRERAEQQRREAERKRKAEEQDESGS